MTHRVKITYDALRYDALRYDALRYDALRYDALRYDALLVEFPLGTHSHQRWCATLDRRSR